ncbi:hypothetical protein SCACP_32960 [Sporomusa carbonis]|uniref:peptidoglycan DD-metalloendopeptidase family protein n=1 Tax=Sporomusa carbonis TaxID=3076075 RepID=UPI003A74762B
MPGKWWTKLTRLGYLGPVLTAGALLVMASLLMFAVVSTLGPASQPPAAKIAPVVEPVQRAQADSPVPAPANPEAPVIRQELSAETQLPSLPVRTVATMAGSDRAAGNEAIRELWNGKLIKGFGWQLHPVYQDWRYNTGVDIGGGEGQVVPALLNGEVTDIFTDRQYGLTVAVKSGKYTVCYSSLASVAVDKNSIIETGRPVGSMGMSPAEREPHLHLAVKNTATQEYIDPNELFPNIPQ